MCYGQLPLVNALETSVLEDFGFVLFCISSTDGSPQGPSECCEPFMGTSLPLSSHALDVIATVWSRTHGPLTFISATVHKSQRGPILRSLPGPVREGSTICLDIQWPLGMRLWGRAYLDHLKF